MSLKVVPMSSQSFIKVVPNLYQSFLKAVSKCPKVVLKLSQSDPKFVLKLSQCCLETPQSCPKVKSRFCPSSSKWYPIIVHAFPKWYQVVAKLTQVVPKCCPCSSQAVPRGLHLYHHAASACNHPAVARFLLQYNSDVVGHWYGLKKCWLAQF